MNSKFIIMWGTGEMLLVLLIGLSFQYLAADCSVVDSNRFGRSTEWKTIELTNLNDDEQFYLPINHKNESHTTTNNNNKKLVEWDDDDNFVGASLVVQEPKLAKLEHTLAHQKSHFGKTGKLIYHGQLKRNNSRVFIDGISLKVNTYVPHSIDRNQGTISKTGFILSHQQQYQPLASQPDGELVTYERAKDSESNANQNGLTEEIEIYPRTDTDWHPITVNSKYRQLLVNSQEAKPQSEGEEVNNQREFLYHSEPIKIIEEPVLGDSRWRPITNNEVNKRLLSRKMRESITNGRKRLDTAHQPVAPTYIEESFEDDRLVVGRDESRREQRIFEQQKHTKLNGSRIGLARKLSDSRWTPVEIDSKKVNLAKQVSSTIEPATITKSPPQNHSDVAQRSASDVNYIYSSQPSYQYDYGSTDNRQTNSYGNYYSNYYNGQQPDSSSGSIVDTVSGQTPEMIDRTQEPNGYQSDYGSSYSASYQPPTRPYSYDTSGYYTKSSIPLRQASPAPVHQSSSPGVRQEHHYHYYNSQQPDRQLDRQQVVQQQSQVVREIQPLLISQPQLIQALPLLAPSTTPAPQIIREIIKEVPQQVPLTYHPIPLATRILLPPPPPPPPIALPVARVSRELEPSYGYSGGYGDSYGGGIQSQSRSLIRHFSNAIPTIGVRQIRVQVPVPTIQIPVRVAAPLPPPPPPTPSVTRQTGSYVIPPQPQKTTTYLTETQAMPTHTTIMQTTQFTPATRTTIYTTDHQVGHQAPLVGSSGYKKKKRRRRRR